MAKEEKIVSVRQEGLERYTRHELYTTWRMMNYRCYSNVHGSYESYGGAGITVCKEWRWDNPNGFVNFLSDKYPRPFGHTLDRIDPYGAYTNENTRWATKVVQQNNFRVSENSPTGVTGVVISNEGLYRAQTWYAGRSWTILITEDITAASAAVSATREFKSTEPTLEEFSAFLQTMAHLSPTGKKLHVRKTSKYYGVSWNKSKRKWRATGYNKKGDGNMVVHLGYFNNEDEAYAVVLNFVEKKGM